jgi:hypothetical protein
MRWSKHAAAAINAIVDDEEVVVAWELVFVYAVQAALLRGAAEAIAVRDETGILLVVSREIVGRAVDIPILVFQDHHSIISQPTEWKVQVT